MNSNEKAKRVGIVFIALLIIGGLALMYTGNDAIVQGASKKEGIAFADGGDECQNGVVATSQKNSGEVVSKDNLSEGFDEEEKDETEKDENKNDEGENDEAFGGLRRLVGKGAQAIGNAAQNVAQKVGNAYNTVKQEYQAGQQIDQ